MMQLDQLRRRECIMLLGGPASALPLAARAQQTMPVIGFLGSTPSGPYAAIVAAVQRRRVVRPHRYSAQVLR
jgi:putative tryptophan/tyrosine transport system substrate-binding protein